MPSSTALSTPRTASRSTARPYANHQNPASAASLTPTTPSEPLKPSTGELSAIIGMLSAIDRNQCPQSIGTPVRNPRNPQGPRGRHPWRRGGGRQALPQVDGGASGRGEEGQRRAAEHGGLSTEPAATGGRPRRVHRDVQPGVRL